MKKAWILILTFATLTICVCSCGTTAYGDTTYRSSDPEDVLNESFCEIKLSDCQSSNTEYTADISGTLFCCVDGEYQTITLKNTRVVFTQEYGNVWKADVTGADGTISTPLYMCRKGENPVKDSSKEETFGDHRLTAMEYKSYGDALYLFLGKYEYLVYERT